jgi:hypothetical protein
MTAELIIFIYALAILMLGIVIGYLIGVARVHLPLVNYFRVYYQRQAEARMAQHTRFLASLIKLHGAQIAAAAICTRAVPGAALGRGGSCVNPQRDPAPGMLYQSTKGGQTTRTNKTDQPSLPMKGKEACAGLITPRRLHHYI